MAKDNEISRRQFLGGLAIGLAAVGLSSCGVRVNPDPSGTTGLTGASPSSGTSAAATTAGATATATAGTSAATATGTLAATSPLTPGTLIAISGQDPATMIEKGFAAIGGIGLYVKKGDIVVIKANFSVPRKPDEAATTNPDLVAAVVRQCLSAGAKAVNVVDFPFSGPTCLNISGIKDAVEKAGGKAYNINTQNNFQTVEMGGENLKSVLYAKDVLNAQVFINMPILKNHTMTTLTMSLKNMMGLVWDRGLFHRTDLAACIAELSHYRKADLIIMDAIKGITDNGPTGPGTIKTWNQVVFGIDPVAVDAYGASLFGADVRKISHVVKAAQLGVGEIDLAKVTIQTIKT